MEKHTPVLLAESLALLSLTPQSVAIDATVGSGGHFAAIRAALGAEGTLLGIDVDPIAVASVRAYTEELGGGPETLVVTGNFREVARLAQEAGLTEVDAILADLGWRTEQFLGGSGKGFSFLADEPLHMTFGDASSYPFTATDIVNEWAEEDIANVLKGYGEERYARKIAKAIVAARPIETAAGLAEVVSSAVPALYRRRRIHPATKTFQALRIAVNDELDALAEFIEGAVALLAPGGRLAIITFHSVEDRIVKQAFRTLADEGVVSRITKKPITAGEDEVTANPRARSAKLRVIEKL